MMYLNKFHYSIQHAYTSNSLGTSILDFILQNNDYNYNEWFILS